MPRCLMSLPPPSLAWLCQAWNNTFSALNLTKIRSICSKRTKRKKEERKMGAGRPKDRSKRLKSLGCQVPTPVLSVQLQSPYSCTGCDICFCT